MNLITNAAKASNNPAIINEIMNSINLFIPQSSPATAPPRTSNMLGRWVWSYVVSLVVQCFVGLLGGALDFLLGQFDFLLCAKDGCV